MKKIFKCIISAVLVLMAASSSFAATEISESDRPDGWAGVKAPKKIGGEGGTVYDNVDTYEKFLKAVKSSSSSKIIYITGTIDLNGGKTGYDYIKDAGFGKKFSSYEDYKTKFAASCFNDKLSSYEETWRALHNAQMKRMRINIPSNTTIIGKTADAGFKNGTLNIGSVSNVVIRNLTIMDAADLFPQWYQSKENNFNSNYGNINIENSKFVWIDHCTIGDTKHEYEMVKIGDGSEQAWVTYDGLVDIWKASDFVTLSYNHFTGHDKTTLIGASDSAIEDKGKLHVTIHHNFYEDCVQRLPRVRFGQVHVYNNYYKNIKMYCIGIGTDAQVYSEANYFDSTVAASSKGYAKKEPGCLTSVNNIDNSKKQGVSVEKANWEPSSVKGYSANVEAADKLPETIPQAAGANK